MDKAYAATVFVIAFTISLIAAYNYGDMKHPCKFDQVFVQGVTNCAGYVKYNSYQSGGIPPLVYNGYDVNRVYYNPPETYYALAAISAVVLTVGWLLAVSRLTRKTPQGSLTA